MFTTGTKGHHLWIPRYTLMGPSFVSYQNECINKTLSFHRMSKTNVFTIDSSRLIPNKNPRTKGLNLQLANFNRSFTNSEGKSHVKGHSTSTLRPGKSPPPAPHYQALAFLSDGQMVLKWQHGMRVTLLDGKTGGAQ